jgi:hypothetical protein
MTTRGKKSAKGKRGKRGRKPVGGTQRYALVPTKLATEHPDPAKQKAIEAFLKTGTVTAGCAAAAMGRSTWYEYIQSDELFAKLVSEAKEARKDALEQEAERRAVKGSDTLLIFLLKAADPNKYRDRQLITEVSAEVKFRIQRTQQLIASKPTWDSEDLLNQLHEVWK